MPRPAKPYLHHDHYVSRCGGEYGKLCHRSEGMAKAVLRSLRVPCPRLGVGMGTRPFTGILFLRRSFWASDVPEELSISTHDLAIVDFKRWFLRQLDE